MAIKFNNKKISIEIEDQEINLHYRRPTKKDNKELNNVLKNLEGKEKKKERIQKKTTLLKEKLSKIEDKKLEIEVNDEIKVELEGGKLSFQDDSSYKKLVSESKTLEALIKKVEGDDDKDESMSDAFFKGHLQKIIPNEDEFKKLDKIASEYTGVYLVIIKEINRAVEAEDTKK